MWDYPDLFAWAQCNNKLKLGNDRRGDQPPIAGFRDGLKSPKAKECAACQSWKDKKIDSPLEPPERNLALQTL